jgi:hypothetical protein
MDTGISTLAPVSGITYLRHSVAWAKEITEPIQVTAIKRRHFILTIPFQHDNRTSSFLFPLKVGAEYTFLRRQHFIA